jgi:Tol biopolymer transport system component
MQALMFFGIPFPDRSAPPPAKIVAPPQGKVVRPCEDLTPPQICVYETHTGQLTQVTDALAFEDIGRLAWSPDGQQIVFDAGSVLAPPQPCDHHLYVVNADGSGLRQIVTTEAPAWSPVWSPDGAWIAFTRGQDLWLIRPDGSDPRWLFGESEDLCIGDLKWSPNSQQIAFVSHECTLVARIEEIWVINRDGTAPQVIHTFERRPDTAEVYWNYEGREIVCAHEYAGEGLRLLLIDAAGVVEPHLIDELPLWWAPDHWPQWRKEQ